MQNGPAANTFRRKLLLVGGCDLTRLSDFCSSNCIEFVNFMNIRPGSLTARTLDRPDVRYDDPSFITADR
jgi:hypothetical protein